MAVFRIHKVLGIRHWFGGKNSNGIMNEENEQEMCDFFSSFRQERSLNDTQPQTTVITAQTNESKLKNKHPACSSDYLIYDPKDPLGDFHKSYFWVLDWVSKSIGGTVEELHQAVALLEKELLMLMQSTRFGKSSD